MLNGNLWIFLRGGGREKKEVEVRLEGADVQLRVLFLEYTLICGTWGVGGRRGDDGKCMG